MKKYFAVSVLALSLCGANFSEAQEGESEELGDEQSSVVLEEEVPSTKTEASIDEQSSSKTAEEVAEKPPEPLPPPLPPPKIDPPEEFEIEKPTRFPQGAISPMFGISVAGAGKSVRGGFTLGAGYFVLDRFQIFGTGSFWFIQEYSISVDPGLKYIFLEGDSYALYLKATGGPIFPLQKDEKIAWTVFGGGGAYIFFTESFGLKLGFLPGYYFKKDVKQFIWMIDVGIMY